MGIMSKLLSSIATISSIFVFLISCDFSSRGKNIELLEKRFSSISILENQIIEKNRDLDGSIQCMKYPSTMNVCQIILDNGISTTRLYNGETEGESICVSMMTIGLDHFFSSDSIVVFRAGWRGDMNSCYITRKDNIDLLVKEYNWRISQVDTTNGFAIFTAQNINLRGKKWPVFNSD